MKTKLMIFIFAFSLSVIACNRSTAAQNNENNVKTDKNFDLTGFTQINLSTSADVVLTQAESFNVKVEATESDLEKLEIYVEGTKLVIKTKNWKDFSDKVTVYVSLPKLEAVVLSGSGNVTAANLVNTENLDLVISGSGNIRFDNLAAVSYNCTISGSGNMSLAGTKRAQSGHLTISGSGNINSEKISTGEVTASIAGSGDMNVAAEETLKARISGSGDISYIGNATIDAKVTGSGSIKGNR
ncbi:MAG TPA: hypothetical protein DCQ31_01545 [Bacteroidales bacterium]|nr:hypothetical protein [Bacteroidales bacterium]